MANKIWWLAICSALLTANPSFALDQTDTASALAGTCSGCHNKSNQAIPSITNRNSDDLFELLMAYQRGERAGTVMNRIARGYTAEELREISEAYER